MSALLDNGIEVTALHNHFFWDDPHVHFMHVHGMGKAADLTKRIKPGLDLIGHGRRPPPLQQAVVLRQLWTQPKSRKSWDMKGSNPVRFTRLLWDATTSI
jgi:hypothetical protein